MKEKKMQLKQKSEAGFSVLELVVVIFILSVVLVAIAANMTRTVKVLWENKSRTIATNLAQNCIEDFNFRNSWMDWSAFMKSNLDSYCLMGTTGLCGGSGEDACTGEAAAEIGSTNNATFLPQRLPDPSPVEGSANQVSFNSALARSYEAQEVKRGFFDEESLTFYTFTIQKHPVDVAYKGYTRQVVDGQVFLQPDEDFRHREGLIVTVDVRWQKMGAALGQENRYQVARQFMAEEQ